MEKYLYIDMDTLGRPKEEMRKVFQHVFGSTKFSDYAEACYTRGTQKSFHYTTLSDYSVVIGRAIDSPLEGRGEAEVIPLSTILLGYIVLGGL